MNFDNLQMLNDLVIPPVDESVTIRIRGCEIRGDIVVPNDAWVDGRVSVTGTHMSGTIQTYEVGSVDEPDVLPLADIRKKYSQGELSDDEMEWEIEQALEREANHS